MNYFPIAKEISVQLAFFEARVNLIIIDWSWTIHIVKDDRYITISLECPFFFRTSSRNYTIDPKDATSTAPLLHLVRASVQSLILYTSGIIHLSFEGGEHLAAKPHQDYKSWNIYDDHGLK